MKHWECECGRMQAFGTVKPDALACAACSYCGTNIFKLAPEPHVFRIQHDANTGEQKYSRCINCNERRPVPVALPKEDSPLLAAVKTAYKKHCMNDDSIGWDELGEILLNALCNTMGDEGFQKWWKEEGK